jgi:outer membrane protein assembly factor BamB
MEGPGRAARRRRRALLCAAGLLAVHAGARAEPDPVAWPQFRGPDGTGVVAEAGIPLTWSRTENVDWTVDIPGRGWSSPIVWGDRVFLTSAVSSGAFKEPTPGIYGNDYMAELIDQGVSPQEAMARVRERDTETSEEVQDQIRWMVYCLDAMTGEILWEREAHRGVPFGGRHRKNTYASETPATDGARVYAYFGNVGLFAFDFDGKPVWERRWDPQPIYLDFGTASSPVVFDGKVLILNDTQGESFLAAIDAETGEEVWMIERRNDNPLVRSGFSTPFIWRHAQRTEIVALGPQKVVSYDAHGEELWRLHGTSMVAAPTPVQEGGRLFVGSGSPSEDIRPIWAIDAGARGNITPREEAPRDEHIAWYEPRGGSYITSPVAVAGRLYVLYDRGFFAAYDAATGERIYRARFGRGGHTFSSSPWVVGDRIYCLSEEGRTFVIRTGDAFEILAENDLDEMSLATPAIAGDAIFLRTATRLYRIAAPAAD